VVKVALSDGVSNVNGGMEGKDGGDRNIA